MNFLRDTKGVLEQMHADRRASACVKTGLRVSWNGRGLRTGSTARLVTPVRRIANVREVKIYEPIPDTQTLTLKKAHFDLESAQAMK